MTSQEQDEAVTTTWLVPDRVEIVRPPTATEAAARGDEVGYDVLYPVQPGQDKQWTKSINHIFLRGVPRALRRGGRVYLKAGQTVFWSAPVLDVLTDSDRISDITGEQHGSGPNLIVALDRGARHKIDAATMGTPDGETWHNRQGLKYVTPGCAAYVKVGPKLPAAAGWTRSSIEVAVERALAKNLAVDRNARRIRVHDGQPRNTLEVDICVPDRRLVIEYDGQHWHQNNQARDTAKTTRLMSTGLRVIRIRDNLAPLTVGDTVSLVGQPTPDDIARAVLDHLTASDGQLPRQLYRD